MSIFTCEQALDIKKAYIMGRLNNSSDIPKLISLQGTVNLGKPCRDSTNLSKSTRQWQSYFKAHIGACDPKSTRSQSLLGMVNQEDTVSRCWGKPVEILR